MVLKLKAVFFVWLISYAHCETLRNGVQPIKRNKARVEVRVGEVMVYTPLNVKTTNNTCINGILEEINELLEGIFPDITHPKSLSITRGEARFVGAIIAGVALGVAAGALAVGTAATVMAAENKKSISENREQINNLREDVLTIKAGFDKVSDALDDVSKVVAEIERFMNSEIIPAIATLQCEVSRNTLRVKIQAHWLRIVLQYQDLLANPYSEVYNYLIEQDIKRDPALQTLIFQKYGIDKTTLESTNVILRSAVIEIKEQTMLTMVSIYRSQDDEGTVYNLPRVPLLANDGSMVISNLPEKVICVNNITDCYHPSTTCTEIRGTLTCPIIARDAPVEVVCDKSCSYTSATTSQGYMGDGEGGVITNCNLKSCRCDGILRSGVVHFVRDSCGLLNYGEEIIFRLRDQGTIARPPLSIDTEEGSIIPPLNLANNISQISDDIRELTKNLGSYPKLGGIEYTPSAVVVWVMVITIIFSLWLILISLYIIRQMGKHTVMPAGSMEILDTGRGIQKP